MAGEWQVLLGADGRGNRTHRTSVRVDVVRIPGIGRLWRNWLAFHTHERRDSVFVFHRAAPTRAVEFIHGGLCNILYPRSVVWPREQHGGI
jgi:hypothetical protein